MGLKDLVTRNRSYRRFQESEPITLGQLTSFVELARLSPTAANLQPLKFVLSNDPERNELIFSCLTWENFIKGSPGPAPGRRPSAYILILGDTDITQDFFCNHGIAAQSILLGAVEMGFGGFIFADIDKEKLHSTLAIPRRYKLLVAVALGVPRERLVINDAVKGNITYWRDINKVHHVPKRPLSEIIVSA
jgi:nitroreductase